MEQVVDNWFVQYQESIIAHKKDMIKLVSKWVSEKIIVKDQVTNEGIKFEMEHDIQDLHRYLMTIYKSVEFNRGMINEWKRNGGVRNHLVAGNDGRAGEQTGTGDRGDEQHTEAGQSNRGVQTWGSDSDIRPNEKWENAFCADFN